MFESGQPPAPPETAAFSSPKVRFFMVVDDHLPRPVMVERLTEPDHTVVIMHLRRAERCRTVCLHGAALLSRSEQIPWRRTFGLGLHIPDADLYNHLHPRMQSLTAHPDVVPPAVRLTE